MDEREIFDRALDFDDPDDRSAYLHEACGEDARLRAAVEALLRSHEQAGSFLQNDGAAPSLAPTLDQPIAVEAGVEIGPYKLLQQVGEGGFGVVYMAEQREPVERRVALKIIKPGMDTKEVIARFEAERQALAMMDHPNIAQVLDVGATDLGRPYFVMELVRGIPLTDYCDKNVLTTRERMTLLIDVCHAIQHAHQKGVIHRDIKPSNVMITLQDGKPIAKVIDFGVSKAINQQLTEKTLFTAFGQMVGTPQYMSPEQAEMSGLDIDTRSDIYSLGVLMYELMTGTTPLDGKRLRSLGYAEMQRVIREEEPPRPSNRISTLGEEATNVAEHRSVNPKRLRDQLSGELDWIVMKALDKDRGRRYESANAFASDIGRYLRNDPVAACPPSATYQLRKFTARHRIVVRTAAAIALLLIAVIAINTALVAWARQSERLSEERRGREVQLRTKAVQLRREAAEQRQQAEIERDKAQAAEAQAASQREVAQAAEQRARMNFQQARRAVDEYLQTVSENELLLRPGMSPLRRQLLESARTFYQTFVDRETIGDTSQKDTATARFRLGRILQELGDLAPARTEYQAVRPSYEQLVVENPDDHSLFLELADICRRLGDLKAARAQCEVVLRAEPGHTAAQRALAATHDAAARELSSGGQWAEAVDRYAEAERIRAVLASGDEPDAADLADLAETHYATAQVLLRQQQTDKALTKYRSGVVVAEQARELDPRMPRYGQLVATGICRLARTERSLQQADDAFRSFQRAESAWSRMVFEFPMHARFKAELARTRRALADYQRTVGHTHDADQTAYRLEQFISQLPRSLPGDRYQLAVVYAQLAQSADDDELSESALASLPGYAEKAVEQLSLAVKQGYRPETGLDQDPPFRSLAERDDFRAVVTQSRREAAAGNSTAAFSIDLPHQLLMVASLRGIAAAHRELGQLQAARTTLDQCLKELNQLSAADSAAGSRCLSERGKTMYVLGHLHWDSRRYPEAKQAWDRGLELLKQAHGRAGEDKTTLAHAIATEEWRLTIVFGKIAFWDEAIKHWDNYVKFGPYGEATWDGRLARIALVANEGEGYEDACRYLVDRFGPGSAEPDILFMLAQGKQGLLAPDKLVELAKQNVSSSSPYGFKRSALGACQMRSGDVQQAVLNLGPEFPFHRAQALYRIGDRSAAKFWLELGERDYANSSRVWLGSRILRSPDAGFWNWWEQAMLQAARQNAWQLIEQRAAPDPWARLFEARGYGLVGDTAKSEVAFAEALDPAPDDPQVWLAAAESRAVLGQHDEAERLFAKSLELAPDDPETWIARGKYFLERGLDSQADADMMRAADLAKDDLDVFIRSGWWAVGPYPDDITKSFPPEESPHPSRPVPRAGADSREHLAAHQWVRVPVDGRPRQQTATLFRGKLASRVHYDGHLTNYAKKASVYTLAYVYSPDARTATLCLGEGYWWPEDSPQRKAQLCISINGKRVLDWTEFFRTHLTLHRVPVHLRAGRNEILVRVSSPDGHSFRLRLGDSPVSQALLAARLGQWQRAVDAFQRIPTAELVRGSHGLPSVYCGCLAAVKDVQQHERAVASVFAHYAHTGDHYSLAWLLNAGTLHSTSTMSRPVLLKVVEDLKEPTKFFVRGWKGRALFRAQGYQEAIDWIDRYGIQENRGVKCILAMAHHELGHETEAKQWLQKANDEVYSHMADRRAPTDEASLNEESYLNHLLLVEAHERITGVPLAETPAWLTLREEINSQLAQMPPETADFDLALMLEPKLPRQWVARARRDADLSRWEDAARDFAEALRLKKNNAGTWLASARYWVRRDNLDKARDAYDQVLELDRDSTYRRQALDDLKGNESMFQAVLENHDGDPAVWAVRATQLCEEKRWTEAAQFWQRRVNRESPHPGLMYQLALLQLAAGDTSQYASTCGELIGRYAQQEIEAASELAAWACILAPGACDDYTPVVELAQRCRDRSPVSPMPRVTLGAALMRAGRGTAAIEELEEGALLAAGDENPSATPLAYAWYLLAITNSQMGNQDAARQWHEKAQRWTREQMKSQSSRVIRWNRQLTLELLERESTARQERDTEPTPPSG